MRQPRCVRPPRLRRALTWTALALATLLLALVAYGALALATLTLFTLLFEPSGHPPLPAAPPHWYTVAFAVLCPLAALSLALVVVRVAWRRRRRQAVD